MKKLARDYKFLAQTQKLLRQQQLEKVEDLKHDRNRLISLESVLRDVFDKPKKQVKKKDFIELIGLVSSSMTPQDLEKVSLLLTKTEKDQITTEEALKLYTPVSSPTEEALKLYTPVSSPTEEEPPTPPPTPPQLQLTPQPTPPPTPPQIQLTPPPIPLQIERIDIEEEKRKAEIMFHIFNDIKAIGTNTKQAKMELKQKSGDLLNTPESKKLFIAKIKDPVKLKLPKYKREFLEELLSKRGEGYLRLKRKK